MKRKTFSKRKMGIGLFVAFLLFIGAFNASVTKSQNATKNLIASHDSASPKYDKNCTNCHSTIPTEKSLNPSIPNAHVAMLPYTPGKENNKKCIWCHRSVDLVQGTTRVEKSKSNLRKGVNMTLCTLCHGPSGPGNQFFQTELSPTQPDGPLLYDLACAACHRPLANSQVKGESASEIQKKINGNKGGMGPLIVLSKEEIQAIANALAQ
jgi:cytochrome c553